MPNLPTDEPLTKVTLNLFTKDLAELKRREGYGWTGVVRSLVRRHLKKSDEASITIDGEVIETRGFSKDLT